MKFQFPLFILIVFVHFTVSPLIAQEQSILNDEKDNVLPDAELLLQKSRCGTAHPTPEEDQYIREVVMQQEIPANRMMMPDCVPMKIHIVRQDDGSGGLSLEDLSKGISNLNNIFLDLGVDFFVCGDINYINDSDFYDFDAQAPDSDSEANFAATYGEAADAVNVWFMNSITTSSGFNAAGYAYFPFNSPQSNRIYMINGVAAGPVNGTFAHELGHYFSLYHTHQGTEFGSGTEGTAGVNNAERVTRGATANCLTNGDLLCDTNADPRYDGNIFDFGSCSFTASPGTDDEGATYTPDIDNIMSYYPDACGGIFTPEQSVRMAQGYATRQGHSAYSLDCAGDAINAPTGLTVTQNSNQVDLVWTDNAANEFGYIVERSTTSSSSGFRAIAGAATGPDGVAYTDTSIESNQTYWYRVRPVNAACTSYSNVETIAIATVYCTPDFVIDCSGTPIQDFTFTGETNISNTSSSCSGDGHTDYSATQSADVIAGNTYNFSVGLLEGTCFGGFNTRYVELYIDFNNDGDFTDAGENIINDASASPAPCYNGSATIPALTTNGAKRMRVIISQSISPTDPCGTYTRGEAEDYEIVVSGGSALPVEFISFTGKETEEGTLLNWETASEVNSEFFVVERSKDGRTFETIGEMESIGGSERNTVYEFLDESPYTGVNYYRLRPVDYDGSFSLSEIITVEYRDGGSISIFPNPVKDNTFALNYDIAKAGEVNYSIIDGMGKLVRTAEFLADSPEGQQQIELENLPTGIYFLRFSFGTNVETLRFVKL